MAELADALDSGSSECTLMQVQVLFRAPLRVPIWALVFFAVTESFTKRFLMFSIKNVHAFTALSCFASGLFGPICGLSLMPIVTAAGRPLFCD